MSAKATEPVVVPPPLPSGSRTLAEREANPAVMCDGRLRSPAAVERRRLWLRNRQRERRAAGLEPLKSQRRKS